VPELVAVQLRGQAFVDELQRQWDAGHAVLPLDPDLPRAAVESILAAARPTQLVDSAHMRHSLDGEGCEEGDAVVLTTSGSTGIPKAVIHTHESLLASADAINEALDVSANDHWLCCLPVGHIAGFAIIVRSFVAGTALTVLEKFDKELVEQSARNGATLTSLVPTTLRRINPKLFRQIIVGGSAPGDLPKNCLASYGMTETGSAIVLDDDVVRGAEIKIVDDEIFVRGPMLFRGYRDNPDVFSQDGWFATGDTGALTNGVLNVHGRRGDMIITGGENVWPAPLEARLSMLPSVQQIAIIGRDDPEWGQKVTAVVVPANASNPPTLEELRASIKEVFPAFCAPKAIELRTDLPTSPLGKVLRRQL